VLTEEQIRKSLDKVFIPRTMQSFMKLNLVRKRCGGNTAKYMVGAVVASLGW